MKAGLVHHQVELRGDPRAVHDIGDGGVDGFIEFVGPALQRFDRANPFLGNMLIDVDLARYTRGLRGPDDIVWNILDGTQAVTSDG